MDTTIEQMNQDLARAAYSSETTARYVGFAKRLAAFVGKPLVTVDRSEVRAFVDASMSREVSSSTKKNELSALLFLFRRTLGRPELVSFIKLPRPYSALPVVLSQGEVRQLLNARLRDRCP